MKTQDYKARCIDQKVKEYLDAFGAVCIEGPKWCGKTWTSLHHCASSIFIADPAGNFSNRRLAEMSPSVVLQGDSPRLIDEWQEVPALWDAVRFEVDRRNEQGQFILTGSSTPNKKGILHSGAGRIAGLRMHPMSLFESGRSGGLISLRDVLADNLEPVMTGEVQIQDLIDAIIRGGWPANQSLPLEQAALIPKEYLKAVIHSDVHRIDDIQRDEQKIELLLRSLARNESTTASVTTLCRDITKTDDDHLDRETVNVYLNLFERLFLLNNQTAYAAKTRSSLRLKQSDKRHLADPSLAAALLNVSPQGLLRDLETLGFLFEALCERDLRIYAESLGGGLYHYQDYANNEIDAVIELRDGSWHAFEIKLGANQIDKAAAQLLKTAEIIEEKGGKPPSTCTVICGLSNAAYRRDDGVYVIPITALRD